MPQLVAPPFLDQLCDAITSLQTPAEAQQFLLDLCTPNELKELSGRWKVVENLHKKLSYRDIHKQTGVSITTIGRVARHLAYGGGGYELIYHRLHDHDHDQQDDHHQ